ncbi:AraC family transcriptional regulator [Aquabacter sp. CN5-332]|uniref:helix-turn-helix transcriptional regulator n=1 Tax=Aquabacter sp. CN5-332 TaxID=3156608 RepID=UPI0032B59DA3
MRAKVILPPLAFAPAAAWEETNADIMSERFSAAGTARMEYRPQHPKEPFRSLSSMMKVGSLWLAANSCSAVEYRASNLNACILLLPFVGKGESWQDKRQVGWSADRIGAFLPCIDTVGYSTCRSVAGINIVEEALQPLARHMLGIETQGPVLDLATPRSLQLAVGRTRFDMILRRLFAAVEHCIPEPEILDRSGLDDAISRTIVMLLKPEAFVSQPSKRTTRRPRLDDTCDYILANLDTKITLTMLEAASGLSPRALQYAFRERFECSPMQWVSERRLDAVRSQLLSAPPGTSIHQIASRYFGHLGDFSQKYKERFGETPSETLAAKRKA